MLFNEMSNCVFPGGIFGLRHWISLLDSQIPLAILVPNRQTIVLTSIMLLTSKEFSTPEDIRIQQLLSTSIFWRQQIVDVKQFVLTSNIFLTTTFCFDVGKFFDVNEFLDGKHFFFEVKKLLTSNKCFAFNKYRLCVSWTLTVFAWTQC